MDNMFCKTRLIGNQCNMSRKLSQLFRANAGDQRAEMARVILMSEKNRNAISAPLHQLVRRVASFIGRPLERETGLKPFC
jgi:hypothetical protein